MRVLLAAALLMALTLTGCSTTRVVALERGYSGPLADAPLQYLYRGVEIQYSIRGENPSFPDFLPYTHTIYQVSPEGFEMTTFEKVRFDQVGKIQFQYVIGSERTVPSDLTQAVRAAIILPLSPVCIVVGACPMQ